MVMSRREFIFLCFAALFAYVCAEEEATLSLEFNITFIYDANSTLNLSGRAPVDWKENQSNPELWTEMVTNSWVYEPSTNETGKRYSSVKVTFGPDCWTSFNATKLKMIMYPFGYPAVSPNFSETGFVDYPTFVTVIDAPYFDNASHTLTQSYESGDVFIGWSCCASFGKGLKTGKYIVIEDNLTSCVVTFEAFGPTVLVSSLKLFYGTLLLILVPAIITILAHCIMVVAQRNAKEKSEASFKRANCECRLFWLVWFIAFLVYIIVVMVPLY